MKDFVFSGLGLRPWRCHACETRFYAWAAPVPYIIYVHCALCGNFDVQRISRELVTEGRLLWLQRALWVPAYRCAPCRHRFFSVGPMAPFLGVSAEPTAGETPDGS